MNYNKRSIVLRSDNLHFDSTLLNGKFLPVFRKIATHNEHIRAGCRWWTRIMEGLVLVIHQNNIWIIFFKIKNKKNKRQIFKEKSNNNDIKRKSSTNRLFSYVNSAAISFFYRWFSFFFSFIFYLLSIYLHFSRYHHSLSLSLFSIGLVLCLGRRGVLVVFFNLQRRLTYLHSTIPIILLTSLLE